MTFKKEEHIEKLYEILKQEGTYLQYLKWLKRGARKKAEDIVEDVYNRYGQNLDGNLDKKFSQKEVEEELSNGKN